MIRLSVSQDEDTWVASSPDLPGWTAVADTRDELVRLAHEGIAFYLERDDVAVAEGFGLTVLPDWTIPPQDLGSSSSATCVNTFLNNRLPANINGTPRPRPVPA